MKFITKILATVCVVALLLTCACACGKKDEKKVIRYLNFKPEIADVYKEIANAYEKETGVKVIIETAASGEYESTLASKMSTDEAPTIFQINGPKGYKSWKDYCEDLSDTQLYSHLTDKNIAIKSGGKVYGIPYVVEGYGIIYNNEIMNKYFALSTRQTKVNSVEEIKNFSTLKTVVEDMQKHKDELGIDGVFASTSLKSGEDWRWQTHLANIPVYYEFKEKNVDLTTDKTSDLEFLYANNFKNIFDLYIENSTTKKTLLGSKKVDDSMAEFALGKCAMVQNGNWAYSQIASVSGNTVKESQVKFMPIYTGVDGEETAGLCVGTENFLAVNSTASDSQKQQAKDFLYWLYSSKVGKDFVTNKLGFISPFDTFSENESPSDPLAKEVLRWTKKDGVESIPWTFTVFPSQTFKQKFGSLLLSYAQGKTDFNSVKNKVVTEWKKESTLANG